MRGSGIFAGMPAHLYRVHGAEDPPRGPTPYKVHLILAADEATARAIASSRARSRFKVARVEVAHAYPDSNESPKWLGFIGNASGGKKNCSGCP